MRSATCIGAALTAALASACVSKTTVLPPPITEPVAAVSAAEQANAAQDPKAAVYLKTAREELADAARKEASLDYKGAHWARERAAADAELALAIARESNQRAEALAARRKAEALKPPSPDEETTQ